jgi:cell division protein FtsB
MPSGRSSQRGASRSGRSTSPATGKGAGGSSARTRKGASTSSSPRKSQTAAKPRSSKGAGSGARRSASRPAPRRSDLRVTSALVFASIALLAWAMYPALKIQYQTGRRVAGLQAEYDSLRKKNQSLRAEVDLLKQPEGVEKAARETLNLTKPGENVYVVIPAGEASGQPAAGPVDTPKDKRDVVTALLDAVFGVRQ